MFPSTDSMGGSIVLPQSLNNYPQQAYVSELLSFSLDRLHKEPELLRVDAERIRRQMQEVAVGHYRAFITAADSLCSIRQEMASVDKHLESLIGEIPNLIMGCNEFSVLGQQILDKRKLNQVLLTNHSTILDLLEVPQLMDTCVRNGNFDEALDLEAFVTKLATVHSKLPIVQSLATEVKQITQSMLSQLLQRLQSNIQLPDCLMVIGYLRRLGVFTEHVLRRQFLKCRDVWLSSIIDDLDQGNTFEYLKRMADCHRMHLYDIVTQYLAIFTDDSPGDGEGYDGGLLYSWAMHRISSYLTVLSTLLPKITEGVTLAILLEQCMYSGMTLGRVGLDFRGLLPPLFETAVMTLFAQNMAATVENFQLALESHRWVALPTVGIIGRGGSQDVHDSLAPPYSLMEYPPLAAFVNGVLAALNELRHCAPENLQKVLALELQHALQSISESLLRYNATRMLRENESNLFLGMCRAFIEVACNYCITCFNRCYPSSKMFHSKDYLENLRRLVFTTSFPVQQQQKQEEKETSESNEVDRNGGSIDVDDNNNLRDTDNSIMSGDAENGNNGPVNEPPTTPSIHEDNVGTTSIISQQTQADDQH